jgi:hypothetical protein
MQFGLFAVFATLLIAGAERIKGYRSADITGNWKLFA